MVDIGQNIKNIRELKNYTQQYVAEKLGLSQRTYSNIEKSKDNVSFKIIEQTANVLEVSINKILELNADVILNNSQQTGGQFSQKIINHGITIQELETIQNLNKELLTQNKMLIELLAQLKHNKR